MRKINRQELKAAIVRAGYTQATLSRKLNISLNSLSSKINGKSRLYLDEVIAICKFLNITEDREKISIFLS